MYIAEQQCKARIDTLVLNPLKNLDDSLPQEYAKGEIGGIRLFMAMTQAQIDLLETEIATLLKEQGNDNSQTDDETTGS